MLDRYRTFDVARLIDDLITANPGSTTTVCDKCIRGQLPTIQNKELV